MDPPRAGSPRFRREPELNYLDIWKPAPQAAPVRSQIGARQDAIVRAIQHKQRPPWNTPLGGEVMLHGGGTTAGDWTWGCVALANPDIKELFAAIPLGTPVRIEH